MILDTFTIILGIIFALTAAICFNLGVVLQKKGLNESSEMKFEKGVGNVIGSFKEFIKNRFWVSGTILGFVGYIPYIIAMGMVGILVTQPLVSIGLIIFVLSAVRILKENLSIIEVICIGFLVIAPILIVFSGISEVKINLYTFVLPLILFLIAPIIICFISLYISKKNRGTQLEGLFLNVLGAICFSLGSVFTNIFTQALGDAHVFPLFFWEFLFGIFWLDYFHFWVFIGFWGMVGFNVLSFIFLQGALQKGKAIILVPLQNIIMFIIPLLAGFLVFQQSFENYLLFTIAGIMVITAIVTLSKFQAEIEALEKQS